MRKAFYALLAAGAALLAPSAADAKVTSGVISLGGKKPEHKFVYMSKMGYEIGSGTFRIRLKVIKPQLSKVSRVPLAIFLDEEWDAHSLDTMEPICDRIKHARTTKQLMLPDKNDQYSNWEKGVLSQTVRPHVWYFVIHNCDDTFNQRTRLRFEFEALQEGGSHFSAEQHGMLWVYGLKLILFGAYGLYYIKLCLQYRRNASQLHPIIWVLSVAIILQAVATLFHFLHLWAYSSNGYGMKPLDVMNEIMQSITQVLLQSLLILIALGYTTLQANLGDLDIIIPVVFIVVIINILLVGFSKIKDDASYKFYDKEGIVGWLVCLVRTCLWIWFMWAVSSCKQEAPMKLHPFLNRFSFAGTVYFLSYPILFFITGMFAAYLRQKFITIGLFLTFALSVRWLEKLFLTKGEFYRVSSLSSTILPGKMGFIKDE